MGDPVSPSYSQGSQIREGYQPGHPEESLSMGGLIHSCASALENECDTLDRGIEQKTSELDELKSKVLRQTENLSKQRAGLEHLKVLTHREIMNRESFIAKSSTLREKSQVLQNYFSGLCKNINLLLLSKEELSDLLKKKMIQEDDDKKFFSEIKQKYKSALIDANAYYQDLETLRDREKSEFKEIKVHLRAQLSMQEQQENELEAKHREIQGSYREKVTMINMLTPQNAELKKTLEKLNHDMATEVKEVESSTSQLQTALKSELERKDKFMENIDAMEKLLYETNTNIIDKEGEIKEFGSKQKQLITKEEELTRTMANEMENLKNLQSKVELMKEQFCILLKVDEENSALRLECEKMEELALNMKVKIKEKEDIENSYASEIVELKKSIEEMENKKSETLTEGQIIEENIRELEKEMNNDKRQHELLSEEIDEPFIELTDVNASINKSLNLVSEQLKLAGEEKVTFDETIKRLKVELDSAEAISKDSDSKLFSQYEEASHIYADLKGQECNLDDMIATSIQDYSKAQSDILLSEEIKFDIRQLEVELENEKMSFESAVERQQESHKNQIQAKMQEMADLRIHYEREFRNKEQSKTDVLVELKENRARITDLQKQKVLTETEIQKTHSKVVKCESLCRKLESKLKRVARVATEDSQSQVSAPPQYQYNQSINILDGTPQSSFHGNKHSSFPSPSGSQSSAMTFDPDSVDLKKAKRKIAAQDRLQTEHSKKSSKQKKQDIDDAFAVWGF